MKIAAITNNRPEKIRKPVEAIGGQVHTSEFVPEPEHPIKSLIALAKLLFQIQRLASDQRNTCLLTNDLGFIALFAGIAGKIYRKPVIIRLGGDPWEENSKKKKEMWNKNNYLYYVGYFVKEVINKLSTILVQRYIVVSEDLKIRVAEETNEDTQNIEVVHQQIDVKRFVQSNIETSEFSPLQSKCVILTVSNLRYKGKYRGIQQSIEQLQPILEQNSDLIYAIAGDGLYFKKLKHLVDEGYESISNQILLLGQVDDIESVYSVSDIFLYITYFDSFPNVVIEAQLCGLPVIANSRFGIPEQIKSGTNGILIDSHTEISYEVERLLNSPEERARLGRNAQKEASKRFNSEAISRDMRSAIESLIHS